MIEGNAKKVSEIEASGKKARTHLSRDIYQKGDIGSLNQSFIFLLNMRLQNKDVDPEPTSADHSPNVLYRVAKSPTVGRHMVADRDIQPGEVIFTDKPACIGPDNSSKPMCLGCHRRVSGNYKCPSCKWPMCREQCTRMPSHVGECRMFKLRKASVTVPWFDKPCAYYDAILPIRVLLLRMSNPKVYKLVCLLMDHNDTIDESTRKQRQRVTDFIRITCRLGQDFSEEEVHHVLGILSVNSFVVHDTDEDNMDLIGLYPWTSLMSHHCIANTKINTADDFTYVCEATTFIPAGAEIVTSYHHYHYQLYGTQYRRNDLRSTWSFDCQCKRCCDPTESGTFVSAVRCEKCRLGFCLPRDSLDRESKWSCDKCGYAVTADDVKDKVKRYENEIDDVAAETIDEAGRADHFERLLRRMRLSLHQNHYWILDVKRRLVDIYGKKKGMEIYKLPMDLVERKIEYCEHLLEVSSVLCPGGSEMRGYLLWEAHGARMRVTQWRWTRMRISTAQYIRKLKEMAVNLKEVVAILGPIRADSEEGQMGSRARDELRSVERLVSELTAITSKAGMEFMTDPADQDEKAVTKPVLPRRRSICL